MEVLTGNVLFQGEGYVCELFYFVMMYANTKLPYFVMSYAKQNCLRSCYFSVLPL